jgi:hypothetical protein
MTRYQFRRWLGAYEQALSDRARGRRRDGALSLPPACAGLNPTSLKGLRSSPPFLSLERAASQSPGIPRQAEWTFDLGYDKKGWAPKSWCARDRKEK